MCRKRCVGNYSNVLSLNVRSPSVWKLDSQSLSSWCSFHRYDVHSDLIIVMVTVIFTMGRYTVAELVIVNDCFAVSASFDSLRKTFIRQIRGHILSCDCLDLCSPAYRWRGLQ